MSELAGVGELPIEVMAVEAGVQVGPTTFTDLTRPGLPEAHPYVTALEALPQVLLLLFFSTTNGDDVPKARSLPRWRPTVRTI
jgi:hypothetical protein